MLMCLFPSVAMSAEDRCVLLGYVASDAEAYGGVIDSRDAIFTSLRLWQDMNHNGTSEASELHTLPELGVESIALDYHELRRRDRHGNIFRYRAKVYGTNHTQLGRWAWDVFLVSGN